MKFIVAVVAALIMFTVSSWIAMLAIGAAHAADPRIPALGWVPVVWLGVALTTFVGSGTQATKR